MSFDSIQYQASVQNISKQHLEPWAIESSQWGGKSTIYKEGPCGSQLVGLDTRAIDTSDTSPSFKFTKPPLILIFLKLEKSAKNAKKMEKPKSKSAKSKKHKSKIKGKKKEKRKDKKGKKWAKNGKKWTCPFAFFFSFSICFLFAFFCFYFAFFQAKSKKKKSKIKAKQKEKESKSKKQKKATKMQMDKSIFFPFFHPFWRSFVFPFILLPVFFGFEVLLFDFPRVFLFFGFFFKFKKH